MDYSRLATQIIEKVGGERNITEITHCATRLRFSLVKNSEVDEAAVREIEGVMGIVKRGGQFQVVIGSDVDMAYAEVEYQLSGMQDISVGGRRKTITETVLDTVSGIFTPIIAPLTATGLLKAILVILKILHVVNVESQTYYILNFISDACFYFLPIMLGYTAAVKFRCNPFMGIMMAGILLHPDFVQLVMDGKPVSFLGVPVLLTYYSSSVLPIILTIWFMSYVERFAGKISPKPIRYFSKPLLTTIIVAPVMLLIIGPVGTFIGDYISMGVEAINRHVSWLVILLMGAFSPLLVMTGMHYSFIPITMTSITKFGFDTILLPGMLAANIAQGAAALAVGLKTKSSGLRQLAISAALTAVMGITEPAMYGVNLKYKKPFIAVMIGGGTAGLYAGITGLKAYALASPGLAGLPTFIAPEGSANLINALITILIAFAVTFITAWFFGFEDDAVVELKPATLKDSPQQRRKWAGITQREGKKSMQPTDSEALAGKKRPNQSCIDPEGFKLETSKPVGFGSLQIRRIDIASPLSGILIPLSEVDDPTFAGGMMGKGVAIQPTAGCIVAPVAGEVVALFKTKHAIGLRSDEGTEILIHIGLDTVRLNGKYFNAHVAPGDRVNIGDLLVEFDIEGIEMEGIDVITPVVITNACDYLDVFIQEVEEVVQGDKLMTIL